MRTRKPHRQEPKGPTNGAVITEDELEGEDRKDGEDTAGREVDAPRGPLPEGATREDYVGGEKPHKSRTDEEDRPASGRKNELV
jgi:hypothetical protein